LLSGSTALYGDNVPGCKSVISVPAGYPIARSTGADDSVGPDRSIARVVSMCCYRPWPAIAAYIQMQTYLRCLALGLRGTLVLS